MILAELKQAITFENRHSEETLQIPAGSKAYLIQVNDDIESNVLAIWQNPKFANYDQLIGPQEFTTISITSAKRIQAKQLLVHETDNYRSHIHFGESGWELEPGLLYFEEEDAILRDIDSEKYEETGCYNAYLIGWDEFIGLHNGQWTTNYEDETSARKAAKELVNAGNGLAVEVRKWQNPGECQSIAAYIRGNGNWFIPEPSKE